MKQSEWPFDFAPGQMDDPRYVDRGQLRAARVEHQRKPRNALPRTLADRSAGEALGSIVQERRVARIADDPTEFADIVRRCVEMLSDSGTSFFLI
ncbi:hypothetical protein HGP14_15815 [Rhizobium sp. P32RR-XVIII]|uniref:hypothetical protein n=1 Tax=Rhizobium sp. P32RR-XVIII TaxID=2726738 RepID=UPI00145658B8|nr:hypothetical protein [Rhizobium sp. P32RR-XVIII]NLS04823.1 hypothetical protein [Rhizobium sp. P32RR-XVIII]